MTCDQCHDREAVVHLTHIAEGQVTMLHLCERCAAEKGVESPASVQDNTLVKFVGALLVLIIVLLIRPQGLLGKAQRVG